jgi:lipoprotein-releasing system permease protein
VTAASVADRAVREAQRPNGARPFAAFEWLLAWRYLQGRRHSSRLSVFAALSILGITLGVAALIIVMAVMNGFRKELLSKILGVNGHLLVQPLEQPLTDYVDVVQRLARLEGVSLVVPFVEGQGFVSGSTPGQGSGILVRGVREAELMRLPSIGQNIRSGSLDGFDEREGVAIGRRLANNLGVQVGDRLTLLGPDGPRTPFGSTPRRKSYPVIAVFEIGMSDLDTIIAFMPMAEAQLFFNQPERATAIEIYAADPDRLEAVRGRIAAAIERPLLLTDWRQRHATIANALAVERNVMFLILTLIVIVATLNVISGLVTLVRNKSHDIAILRTMGATRWAVMRVFLINGLTIGVVGTLAGLLLGLLVCSYIREIQDLASWISGSNLWDPTVRFLTQIPAEIDPRETATVVVVSLALSLAATLYPSWRAARLDPVDALRYE